MILRHRYFTVGMTLLSGLLFVAFLFVNASGVNALNTHSVDLEDSSSQYLSIADGSQSGLDLTGDQTQEAWIKLESLPASGNKMTIVGKYDPTGNNRSYAWGVHNNGGTLRLYFRNSSDGTGANTVEVGEDYSFSTGTWYHVAVAYSASSGAATFYVNGSPLGTQTGLKTSAYNSGAEFAVGANEAHTQEFFDGLIDDIRIWNIDRTDTEISDDRDRELNGNETGLVSYWKLNNSLIDSTANGNTLTNNGSAVHSTNTPFVGFTELLRARKSINESLANSQTLQNDDELSLSLATNKTYAIDGVLFASSTSATPDIVIAFFGQTDFDITIGYTNDVNELVLESGDESNRIALPGNTPTSIHLHGTVKTGGTSGDFQLKWAQATSNAAATTVMKGSFIRAEEI